MQPDLALARRFLAAHPPPGEVLLCSITGSHLYGFPSIDSDLDIKGIHLHPTVGLLGLHRPPDHHDRLEIFEGMECDLTTHEASMALSLLLDGNGNLLERITSPFQLLQTPATAQLGALLPSTLSRRCRRHYRGYLLGMTQELQRKKRLKSLLYAYRVALTGIHLLRTGEVESNLPNLAHRYGVPGLAPLIDRKREAEKTELSSAEIEAQLPHLEELGRELDSAHTHSILPEKPSNASAVENWLIGLRQSQLQRHDRPTPSRPSDRSDGKI